MGTEGRPRGLGTEGGNRKHPDHSRAPILEALDDYHRLGRYGFTPPGHRQGRGVDDRVLAVIGPDAFASDVLAAPGLDDRLSQGGYLTHAEELMADAVGADPAYFSTCGSSLSVKAAMMAVYPPGIPAVIPGERLGEGVLDYLRTGHDHCMDLPDASDPELKQIRVVAG